MPLDAGGLHFLDLLLDPLRGCVASAKAKVVEVHGFSKVTAVYSEEIDKIKECLHLMEIAVRDSCTELGQLDAILHNKRDFPTVDFLKISLEKKDGDELFTGEAVAESCGR